MQEKLPRSDYRGMMPSQHHALIFDHSSTCSDINVLTLVVLHKLQAELCRLNVSKRFWLSRTGLASSQHDAGDASRTANQPARRQYPELESIIRKLTPSERNMKPSSEVPYDLSLCALATSLKRGRRCLPVQRDPVPGLHVQR